MVNNPSQNPDKWQPADRRGLSDAILNSLPAHIAVVDKHGVIIAINLAWKLFAQSNCPEYRDTPSIGDNYLAVCERASSEEPLACEALAGIQAVISGESEIFELEYACDSPGGESWFVMTVVPLLHGEGGAVVSHLDVTDSKQAERKLRSAYDQIRNLKERLEQENKYLLRETSRKYGHEEAVGRSVAIGEALGKVDQVAQLNSTVLLLGETGTGKELLARAVHAQSQRRHRAMVKVNCAALPATLIEAELFGREKGAYTGSLTKQIGRFEVADGATLFLDEIGELPLELQSKLLRVLQEGEFERLGSNRTLKVDVRLIVATNRDLDAMVKNGSFREDLYYRLNVFPILVPPLRDRREDIPALVWRFVQEIGEGMGKSVERIPEKSMEALKNYAWPGNIRELRNLVERALILSTDSTLRIELPRDSVGTSRTEYLDDVQRAHILDVLNRTDWRVRGKNGAAERLGIKPTTLDARMHKLGIHRRASKTQ